MSVSSIASALQAAQKLPLENLSPTGTAQGANSLMSFGNTLSAKINEQAQAQLHSANLGSSIAAPTNYKGFALQMVQDTENLQAKAGQEVQSLVKGQGNSSLHTAMIAMEEASVSFQMLVEMRNKIVDSLQELMRMQI